MQHTPDLVQIQQRYADRDVVFVALTDETKDDLDSIQTFAATLNVPWPIGYGASETTRALKIPGYPTTFVIGRSGKVAWNSFELGTLDGAIRNAL